MRYSFIILLLGCVLAVHAQDTPAPIYDVITPDNVMQLEEIMRWDVSEEGRHSAALNPAGDTIALALGDGLIRLVDVTTLAEIITFEALDFEWSDLQFSQDGERIVLTTSSRSVRVWDVATGALLFTIDNISLDTAFHIDSNLTTFGVRVGSNLLMENIIRSETNLITLEDLDINSFAIGYDGEQVVFSTSDARVVIYDTQVDDVTYTFEAPVETDVLSVGFSTDGQYLWASWYDRFVTEEEHPSLIRIWRVDDGVVSQAYDLDVDSYDNRRILFHPRGDLIIIWGHDGRLNDSYYIWSLSTERVVQTLGASFFIGYTSTSDEQLIAIQGGTHPSMIFYRLDVSRPWIHTISFDSGAYIHPQFSADGRFLLTAHVDGVRLWAVPL